MNTEKQNLRFKELDGLRGVAALSIVIYHFTYSYDRLWGYDIKLPKIFSYGSWGVPLFFMVSGFVIFWSILRQKSPSLFALSRFRRLYPPFWGCLALSIPLVMIFGPEELKLDTKTLIVQFTMIQEYLGFKNYDGVFWTLTLELAFYSMFFLLALFKQLDNLDYWIIGWLLSTAVAHSVEIDQPYFLSKILIFKYNIFFAWGICFYKIRTGSAGKATYLVLLICVLLVPLYYDLKASVACYSLFAIFWLTIMNKLKILASPIFVFFGSISYSLYLIHQNLGYTLIHNLEKYDVHPVLSICITTVASIILAFLIYRFIERPSSTLFKTQLTPKKLESS